MTRRCQICHESKPITAYSRRPDMPRRSNRDVVCKCCRHDLRVHGLRWHPGLYRTLKDPARAQRLSRHLERIRSHPEWLPPERALRLEGVA